MPDNPSYTKYHPKWYRKRIPIFWWMHKWVHAKFILRELTSLSVALYALVMLFQIHALSQGPEAYARFLALLQSPVSIIVHLIALLSMLFHSITWFNLAQKAIVVRLGKKPLPGAAITASNYLAWIVISAVIAWILLTL